MSANARDLKQFLHRLADQLPAGATIDQALYQLVVRREIEMGIADSEAGRTTSLDDFLAKRGITE